ncbi:replication protein A, subunit RPA32 [Peniophora sp. CONT]|nr:replication protein A, subunit RPA32 [Peniophora sp. CONT]
MSQSQFGGGGPYYGNEGGGGGGGYLTGGSPFGSGTGSPGGAEKRSALSHAIRPVTIKQLHAAQQQHGDAPWTIENSECGHMSLVAQVVSVRSQATNTVYYVDDGTGRIEVRRWRDASMDSNTDPNDQIPQDSWVRVTGVLKTYNNKRHLNHITIHRLTDFNELWYHQLDVIVATLTFEKGLSSAPQGDGDGQHAGHSASAYAAHAAGGGGSDEHANLPPVQKAIVEWIMSHPDDPDDGYHIGVISRHVNASEDEFAEALEALMENGTIFTTIDDTHVSLAR